MEDCTCDPKGPLSFSCPSEACRLTASLLVSNQVDGVLYALGKGRLTSVEFSWTLGEAPVLKIQPVAALTFLPIHTHLVKPE